MLGSVSQPYPLYHPGQYEMFSDLHLLCPASPYINLHFKFSMQKPNGCNCKAAEQFHYTMFYHVCNLSFFLYIFLKKTALRPVCFLGRRTILRGCPICISVLFRVPFPKLFHILTVPVQCHLWKDPGARKVWSHPLFLFPVSCLQRSPPAPRRGYPR